MAAILPLLGVFCMAVPRNWAKEISDLYSKAPAAENALNSPNECPPTTLGSIPKRFNRSVHRDEAKQIAGCATSVLVNSENQASFCSSSLALSVDL